MSARKAPPTARFCEQCGSPLEEGALFCAACGSKVAPPEQPAVVAVPLAEQPAVAPRAPRRPGAWARGARIGLAWLLAAVVCAGIGLWPQYATHLPGMTRAADRATASAWLSEGPADPVVFTKRPVWATPAALKADPDTYQQRIVLLAGEPVSAGTEGGLAVAAFEADGERIVVGYPGGGQVFAKGRSVSVAGVLAPTGDELLAVAVSPGVPGDKGRNRDLATLTLIAAGAFALTAVFVRVRRSRNRRAVMAAVVAAGLIATTLLGGCEIVIRTEVNRDGSGTVGTRVVTGEESMTEMMGLPNAEPFIESWIASQERLGLKVERTTNQLKVDRTFATLEDFGATSGAVGTSWSRLGAVDLPDGRHVFFLASLDTSTVYPDTPEEGADTTAYDKLKEEIDASTLRYELKLPGTVLGTNADSTGSWDMSMGGRRFLFAESLTGTSDADSRLVAAQQVWVIVVRWLFAIAAGLLVYGLVAYPWRTKGGDSRG